MRVLFLDHDGVICFNENFDKKAVRVLNSILKETNCEIVVSSMWCKYYNLKEIQDYYKQQEVVKSPIDMLMFETYEQKSETLLKYIENNRVDSYCVVDDVFLNISNFVLCDKSNEGIKKLGLKNKIIKNLISNRNI